MAIESEQRMHKGCRLVIGDLVFVEDRCVIEGDGSKHLVFTARRGLRRITIKLPEGSWQYHKEEGVLRLKDDKTIGREAAKYLVLA